VDAKTVRKYIAAAEAAGMVPGRPPAADLQHFGEVTLRFRCGIASTG
jgi:hypothetical protein